MKSKKMSVVSSIGSSIVGFFGSGCGVVCAASGSTALLSIIGLPGSTLKVFGKS